MALSKEPKLILRASRLGRISGAMIDENLRFAAFVVMVVSV